MREKFSQGELLQVKRRWEICTIIYIFVMLAGTVTSIGDTQALIEYWNSSGDLVPVLIIFSLIGRKCPKVHHFSIAALCLMRTCMALT